MLHLTADRLAALADEQPNEIEAAHLAACPRCCGERQAQLRLRELARADARRLTTPLTTWEGIEAALRDPAAGNRTPDFGRGSHAPLARPAAGLSSSNSRLFRLARGALAACALLASGVAAGRYSAGASPLGVGARALGDTARAVITVTTDAVRDSLPALRSTAEAIGVLTRAEREYQHAATFLAAHDPAVQPAEESPAVYQARLAALDEMVAATRTALHEAPLDPVINRYYLAALGAREAAVQELGTALPPGQSVSRF